MFIKLFFFFFFFLRHLKWLSYPPTNISLQGIATVTLGYGEPVTPSTPNRSGSKTHKTPPFSPSPRLSSSRYILRSQQLGGHGIAFVVAPTLCFRANTSAAYSTTQTTATTRTASSESISTA
ncbi:unnamed protein product [Cochlearia groenlandica]